eukprot:SAG11_NODE_261_length_11530_cov_8.418861_12_plen_163_part_00
MSQAGVPPCRPRTGAWQSGRKAARRRRSSLSCQASPQPAGMHRVRRRQPWARGEASGAIAHQRFVLGGGRSEAEVDRKVVVDKDGDPTPCASRRRKLSSHGAWSARCEPQFEVDGLKAAGSYSQPREAHHGRRTGLRRSQGLCVRGAGARAVWLAHWYPLPP